MKFAAIADPPFPTSKRDVQAFLGCLNNYSRFIQNKAIDGAVGLFPGAISSPPACKSFELLKQSIAKALILGHFNSDSDVHVIIYANYWAQSCTLIQITTTNCTQGNFAV